ncbi:MAG: alcohol dehydrogenase catalytic domain-containing protein [Ruminococcus sp.]|nr:alcohol dehydrogenase catalytic domain-containing protein [Ruminococcus sp.]MBQ1898363.1 alcohol dehydrogenase catalytic domain-containing protein [Ruminococcus sp.]
MINTVYRLCAPRRFEIAFNDIDVNNGVIVRPTHLSICNADQRYYQGTRDIKVLKEKLPMALIHEGIGQVVFDTTGNYQPGDRVVMVPNIPCEKDEYIAENYLRTSKFCGSSADGFLQEYYQITPDRLVKLPEGVDLDVAAFTEIVSVSVHAITRFQAIAHDRRDRIGVWGDGNLAFITSLFLKKMLPDSEIHVFGINREKLSDFSFVDGTHLTTEIPEGLTLDHAFECVGGNGSPIAIEQIIGVIKPEGTISILGVSEYPVPINTRMILEKGLRLFGTSRSGKEDFRRTVELYREHPEIPLYLSRLVGSTVEIDSFADIKKAFEIDIRKAYGKTILHWNI